MLRRGLALWPRGHRDMFGTQLSFHQANMFLQDCGGQKRTNIGRCMYVTTVFCRSGRGSWQVHMVQQLPTGLPEASCTYLLVTLGLCRPHGPMQAGVLK
jgi:hypothetical protein